MYKPNAKNKIVMKKAIFTFTKRFCMFLIIGQTIAGTVAAQNLIPNPSFELMNACPTGWHEGFPFPSNGGPTFAMDWYMPSVGTSDYFNACAPEIPTQPMLPVSVPFQFVNYQVPRTGNGYAGGILNSSHCEYIESPLTSPLGQGHRIYASFWINSQNFSCGGADQIGIYFSQNAIEMPNTMFLNMFTPQIESPPNVIFYDTLNWMKISGSFIAAGNERWATFGFFKPWNDLNKQIVCSDGGFGIGNLYYYYDDVCVLDIDGPTPYTQTIDTSLCGNQSLTFTARAGAEYFWSDGSTNAQLTITQPGTYWVTIVNADECTFIRDTIIVRDASTIIPLNIHKDTIICEAKEITLTVQHSNFNEYTWSTGETTASINVNQPGTYWVKATTDCSLGLDTVMITKGANCDQCLVFPNAFSPNNDGRNDEFKPVIFCDVVGFKMDIFNRYGQLVYSTTKAADGWDGRFQSKMADVGVYFYHASFLNKNSSEVQTVKGDISLIW